MIDRRWPGAGGVVVGGPLRLGLTADQAARRGISILGPMSPASLVVLFFERRFEIDYQRRTSSSCT